MTETDPARPGLASYAAAFLLQLVLAAVFVHAWDGFVFQKTTQEFVEHGITPYDTIDAPPDWVYPRADVATTAEWYAYPPLPLLLMAGPYFVAHALHPPWTWTMRVAWKLPILVANVLLPLAAYACARAFGARPRRAAHLERVLLWTPFMWVVGPLWGMTEPLMGLFLLLSLAAFARGRITTSGIWWGLAGSVKIFPWFVYPALLGWLAFGHERRLRDAARHGLAATAAFAAVSLPFFLRAPHGFTELVLLMHLQRVPAGLSPMVPLYYGLRAVVGVDLARIAASAVSLAGFVLFFLLTLGWVVHHRHRTTQALPFALAGLLSGFLLLNKVLHWQYFFLPFLLFALSAAVAERFVPNLDRFLERAFLVAGLAYLLYEARAITLVPHDIALRLWGRSAEDLIASTQRATGLPAWVYPYGLAQVALALLAWCLAPLARPFLVLLRESSHGVAHVLHYAGRGFPQGRLPRPLLALIVVLLLVLPSGTAFLLHLPSVRTPPRPVTPLGPRALGAYLDVWWRNPSYDYSIRDGNWDYATTRPAKGYYSSFYGEIDDAVRSLQACGFDFALVPVNQVFDTHTALETVAHHAQSRGFHWSPLLDFRRDDAWTQRVPATNPQGLHEPAVPATVDHWRAYVDQLSDDALHATSLLRLTDERPIVFLQGARYLGDPASPEEVLAVAHRVMEDRASDVLTTALGSDAWQRDPSLLKPGATTAREPLLITMMWNQAVADTRRDAWQRVLEPLIRRVPDVAFVVAASDAGAQGFPFDRVVATFEPWDELRPGGDPAPDAHLRLPRFSTLHASYDASLLRPLDPRERVAEAASRLDAEWTRNATGHDLVLVHSWNAHHEGTAFEPTLEGGDGLCQRLPLLADAWRTPRAALN